MEQITVTSTIEKIQRLIDDNSGDIGRLEHISDFLKKNKPLYNTDKKYLEKKINSKIIIQEKKKIIKKESETEQIKKLIESGKGDPGRLEHIHTMLKKQKKLYESDKQYLENNFKIKIIEKQKGKIKIEKIENKVQGAMPKDWKPANFNNEVKGIQDYVKIVEKQVIKKKENSGKTDQQQKKLNKLIKERKNNEEQLKEQREILEKEIRDERILIQNQTKLTETVNLQRKELLKVKNQHSKILKKIDFEKNSISKELEIQKKQLGQAQAE